MNPLQQHLTATDMSLVANGVATLGMAALLSDHLWRDTRRTIGLFSLGATATWLGIATIGNAFLIRGIVRDWHSFPSLLSNTVNGFTGVSIFYGRNVATVVAPIFLPVLLALASACALKLRRHSRFQRASGFTASRRESAITVLGGIFGFGLFLSAQTVLNRNAASVWPDQVAEQAQLKFQAELKVLREEVDATVKKQRAKSAAGKK